MSKTYATVINWDEIEGQVEVTHLNGDQEITLTKDNDQTLIQELRDLNEETPDDDDNNYYWRLIGIAHLPKTTIVEWKSGRGHHGTTQICWMP